jgi:hypothetical protein
MRRSPTIDGPFLLASRGVPRRERRGGPRRHVSSMPPPSSRVVRGMCCRGIPGLPSGHGASLAARLHARRGSSTTSILTFTALRHHAPMATAGSSSGSRQARRVGLMLVLEDSVQMSMLGVRPDPASLHGDSNTSRPAPSSPQAAPHRVEASTGALRTKRRRRRREGAG